jgi:hypothetical protein
VIKVVDKMAANREYKFMSLSKIRDKEPDMKRLKVSEVSRSKRGFLTVYKKVGGKKERLSKEWQNKRNGFIARHKSQYDKNPTTRRKLALQAWAYNPK